MTAQSKDWPTRENVVLIRRRLGPYEIVSGHYDIYRKPPLTSSGEEVVLLNGPTLLKK